jgi:hypothetical protein
MTAIPRMTLTTLLALCGCLLSVSVVRAGEIRTLDGNSYSGDIVSFKAYEVQLRTGEGDKLTTFPLKDVISVDFAPSARPITRTPYLRVRLVDGSQLYCLTVGFQNKTMKLLLLSGQSLDVAFDQVHTVVCDAHDTNALNAFDVLQAESPKQDVIRVQNREGTGIEPYEGVILGANDVGTRLQFKERGLPDVANLNVARLRAMYFYRTNVGPGEKAIARISDTFGNTFTATRYVMDGSTCQLTMQSGQDLKLMTSTISKFDLTPGKLVYLSDLEPSKVEETPILAELFRFRRDKNLEGGPLSVGRRIYPKGLALHSRTVLEYDVKGYSSFRTVLGLDDAMAGSAHAIVRIEADDKEVLKTTVSSKDNKPQELNLDMTGVQKLRLIVEYGDDLDLGDHVNFADARLIK